MCRVIILLESSKRSCSDDDSNRRLLPAAERASPLDDEEDDEIEKLPHIVLINHEEQYSLWRADMEIPGGWRQVWGPDSMQACMSWVDEVWTDMRPLSLRRAMEAAKERQEAGEDKNDA